MATVRFPMPGPPPPSGHRVPPERCEAPPGAEGPASRLRRSRQARRAAVKRARAASLALMFAPPSGERDPSVLSMLPSPFRSTAFELARAYAKLRGEHLLTTFGDSLAGDVARFDLLRNLRRRFPHVEWKVLAALIEEDFTP